MTCPRALGREDKVLLRKDRFFLKQEWTGSFDDFALTPAAMLATEDDM